MRSLILLSATLLASAAVAQKTAPKLEVQPTDRAGQRVELGPVQVTGHIDNPMSGFIIDDGTKGGVVALSLERSFVDCIPGSLDRERLELRNGEVH